MIPELSFACRTALWIAERIVPAARREDWSREWQSELWHWMAGRAAVVDDPSTRSALLRHAGGAIQDALYLRLDDAAVRERWDTWRAGPAFCLTGCLLLIALLAWTSRGFETSRRLLAGLPFRDPSQLVLLSQTGPFMGQRLGFRAQDLQVFRDRSRTVESPASYFFYSAIFKSSGVARKFPAVMISPDFLIVLGVSPAVGRALAAPSTGNGIRSFLVSFTFWHQELNGDPNAIGKVFRVAGKPHRLAGILPADFSFLSATPSILTIADSSEPWPEYPLALRGSVARLRSGMTPLAAERELEEVSRTAWPKKRGAHIEAVQIVGLTYRAPRLYGSGVLACLAIAPGLAILAYRRSAGQGIARTVAVRYCAFFALKPVMLLISLLAVVLEFTGAAAPGPTGNVRWANELVAAWLFLFGAGILLWWAWSDQRTRCPVCLRRMGLPVRIGVPGQMLLQHTGLELMCPKGHGTVYASESVLGAQVSDRWMSLDDPYVASTYRAATTGSGWPSV